MKTDTGPIKIDIGDIKSILGKNIILDSWKSRHQIFSKRIQHMIQGQFIELIEVMELTHCRLHDPFMCTLDAEDLVSLVRYIHFNKCADINPTFLQRRKQWSQIKILRHLPDEKRRSNRN